MSIKNALPIVLSAIMLIAIGVGAVSYFAFNNNGTVAAINVAGFLEASCTTPLADLTWPIIAPGENATQTIYVNSTSTIPATLNLTTSNWNPTYAEPLVTYTWNIEGVTIPINTILEANITLTHAPDMGNVTTYSFTAVINTEEVP